MISNTHTHTHTHTHTNKQTHKLEVFKKLCHPKDEKVEFTRM